MASHGLIPCSVFDALEESKNKAARDEAEAILIAKLKRPYLTEPLNSNLQLSAMFPLIMKKSQIGNGQTQHSSKMLNLKTTMAPMRAMKPLPIIGSKF